MGRARQNKLLLFLRRLCPELLSRSRPRYTFGRVRGSEGASPRKDSGFYRSSRRQLRKEALKGWVGAPHLGECKNYHQRWSLPMRDCYHPTLSSLWLTVSSLLRLFDERTPHEKGNSRSQGQQFNQFDDPSNGHVLARRDRTLKCGLPISLPASSISVTS